MLERTDLSSLPEILAEQRQFLAALLDLGDLATVTTDDEAFYQQLLERSVAVVPGAEGGSIQLSIPDTQTFRFVAAVGYDLAALQLHVLHKEHFFRDATNPRAEIVHDLGVDARSPEIAEWLESAGRLSEIQSNVSAPVVVNGQTVAFLSIDNFTDANAMTDWSAEMTTVLARFIGNLYLRRQLEAEQAEKSAELQRRAMTDELTGISNRSHLLDSLGGYLDADLKPAVLFCDLDNFKLVNDSLGHGIGDALIAQVADRLTELWNDDDVLVGRLGGDEFLIVLANATEADAVHTAQQALDALQEPFTIDGSVLHARMSLGISTCSDDSDRTAGELMQQADTALYAAKARGGHRYVVFGQVMSDLVARRLSVEQELRVAIDTGGIEAHYQPIVHIPSGRLIGVEALVRWRKRSGELIAPGGFLDVAEEVGLLPEIGRIMLSKATRLGGKMERAGLGLYVSINVSAQELLNGSLVDDVTRSLREAGMRPGYLLAEITESSVLNPEHAMPVLWALRDAGVQIALDDFGTGFSSLAHLRTLPIDAVKIDRSFVNDVVGDQRTRAMTKSLVEMCAALDLQVIVEGVETTAQADVVSSLGGTLAQGYLYYRPMPEADLWNLVSPRGISDAA